MTKIISECDEHLSDLIVQVNDVIKLLIGGLYKLDIHVLN